VGTLDDPGSRLVVAGGEQRHPPISRFGFDEYIIVKGIIDAGRWRLEEGPFALRI